jgi:hypothetical protein
VAVSLESRIVQIAKIESEIKNAGNRFTTTAPEGAKDALREFPAGISVNNEFGFSHHSKRFSQHDS